MDSAKRDARDPVQGFSPAGQLLHLITSYWISQAICVAAELGVADRLGREGRPVEDLARDTGTEAHALYRLLRALAASGVFSEVAPRAFALSPMGALLKRDVPGNLREFARFQADGWHWRAWGALADSVRSGRPARLDVEPGGLPPRNCFDYLATRPESAAIFDAAMTGYTSRVHAAVSEAYDFTDARVVMDVGGGQGALLVAVLERHPHLRGLLFDRPAVIDGAPARFAASGVQARTQAVGGDFFVGLPRGADTVLLCAVIHDWDDTQALAILHRVVEAMAPDGRLLIIENVIPEGNQAHPGKLIDLEMLLITGGRERTRVEFDLLLEAAGLRVERLLPTAVSVSIIEAVRR